MNYEAYIYHDVTNKSSLQTKRKKALAQNIILNQVLYKNNLILNIF